MKLGFWFGCLLGGGGLRTIALLILYLLLLQYHFKERLYFVCILQ